MDTNKHHAMFCPNKASGWGYCSNCIPNPLPKAYYQEAGKLNLTQEAAAIAVMAMFWVALFMLIVHVWFHNNG